MTKKMGASQQRATRSPRRRRRRTPYAYAVVGFYCTVSLASLRLYEQLLPLRNNGFVGVVDACPFHGNGGGGQQSSSVKLRAGVISRRLQQQGQHLHQHSLDWNDHPAQRLYDREGSQAENEYYHRRLPEGFTLCGTPDPTDEEKVEMGEAFAELDAELEEELQNDSPNFRHLAKSRARRKGNGNGNNKNNNSNKNNKKKGNADAKYKKNGQSGNSNGKNKKGNQGRKRRPSRNKKAGQSNKPGQNRKNPNKNNNNHSTKNRHNTNKSNQPQQDEKKTLVVPVWFHIMQKTAVTGALTKEQINTGFMKTLRSAYAPTPVQFSFKGVTRHINEKWFNCEEEFNMKSSTRRGGPETLNIFVCDLTGSRKQGGNAHLPPVTLTHPQLDGVLIMNPALGGAQFAHQALVHEVGQ